MERNKLTKREGRAKKKEKLTIVIIHLFLQNHKSVSKRLDSIASISIKKDHAFFVQNKKKDVNKKKNEAGKSGELIDSFVYAISFMLPIKLLFFILFYFTSKTTICLCFEKQKKCTWFLRFLFCFNPLLPVVWKVIGCLLSKSISLVNNMAERKPHFFFFFSFSFFFRSFLLQFNFTVIHPNGFWKLHFILEEKTGEQIDEKEQKVSLQDVKAIVQSTVQELWVFFF